eukprot:TRINITY_DN6484_c0_g1_i2.p1 TRINITY_DN6484_c0_g1~~TRINITY_DN6484_c0_g1_i2.p1  ORF type:complete len:583 (+),score=112.06 TRINITY_DN6484_c0_g1_i2:182-1750(+)
MAEGRREYNDFINSARVQVLYAVPHHINVVRFLGIVSRSNPLMVATELCSHGDLQSLLRSSRPDRPDGEGRLTICDCLKMAADVARGMAYLSNQDFVHRDLCARNCLVHDNLTVKISGFDSSFTMEGSPNEIKNGHITMNVRWMSPQVISDGDYTTKSDVWSYGILLFECVTFAGKPYPNLSNQQVCDEVVRGHTMAMPDHCPHSIYRIMRRCWHIGPQSRPDFEDLLGMTSEELRRAKEGRLDEYSRNGSSTSLVPSRRTSVGTGRRPSQLSSVQHPPRKAPRPSQVMRENPAARSSPNMLQAQLLRGSKIQLQAKPPTKRQFEHRPKPSSSAETAPQLPTELLTRSDRPTIPADTANAPRMAGMRSQMGNNTLGRSIKKGAADLKRRQPDFGGSSETLSTSVSTSISPAPSPPPRHSIAQPVPSVLSYGTSAFENVDRANPLFARPSEDALSWDTTLDPEAVSMEPIYYMDPDTNDILPASQYEQAAGYDIFTRQHVSRAPNGRHLADPDDPEMVFVQIH